uniref:Uncharacterized protein n=1 Tax=Chrysotila carterae TaxID=13221 RepID=A0A6S9VTB9_CHRCT
MATCDPLREVGERPCGGMSNDLFCISPCCVRRPRCGDWTLVSTADQLFSSPRAAFAPKLPLAFAKRALLCGSFVGSDETTSAMEEECSSLCLLCPGVDVCACEMSMQFRSCLPFAFCGALWRWRDPCGACSCGPLDEFSSCAPRGDCANRCFACLRLG